MRYLIAFLFILPITINAQVIGGAGVCHVNGNPNTVLDLQTQDLRSSCAIAIDTVTGNVYRYNKNLTQGSRWVLRVDSVTFNPNNSNVLEGRLQYSDDIGDFIYGGDNDVQLEVTQKHVWYVRNISGSTLNIGEVVYADSTIASSGRIAVKRFIANGTIPARYILGIVAAPISNGQDGYVVDFGKVRGYNTSSFLPGTILYPSATTPGALTSTEPLAPNLKIPIAFTINQTNNGTIAVRLDPGGTLSELHDVSVVTPSNGNVLTYSSGVWAPAAPVDGSVTNEGVLGVGAGLGANTSVITSNTSGATGVTISASTGLSISETTNSNGGTITLTNSAPDQTVGITGTGITVGGTYPNFTLTAADQSATNELQTLSHASDATSHTVTLSNTGGSLKLIEGSNITLTTNNTNEVTIAASGGSGATDLTFTGSSSPVTLNSSTGTDVTFVQSGLVTLSQNANQLTIGATIPDASLTYTKIQNSDSLSVLGRASNTNGVLDEIIAASDHQVLRRNGNSIGFGAVALNQSNAVTGQLSVANGGTGVNTLAANKLLVGNGTNAILQPTNLHWDTTNNRLGIGVVSPTARLHLQAGSTAANTGPLKFTSQASSLLTTPEAGVAEYNGTNLFFTPSTTRNILAQINGSTNLGTNQIPYVTGSSGYLTGNTGFTWNNAILNIEPSNGTVHTSNTFIRGGNTTTTGVANLIIGLNSGTLNTSGGYNTFLGYESGIANQSGSNNTFIGYNAGINNTTGSNNTFIGYGTGTNNTTGGNNVVIGNNIFLATNNATNQMSIKNVIFATGASGTGSTPAGSVGIALNSPTARLHLPAGTATANTAPLKFTSGTNLTNAEAGAMEYDGTNLFFSPSTTRNILAQISGSTPFTANDIPYATTNGYLTRSAGLTFNGTNFATTGTASATKFIPTGGTATGNGMYLPVANTLAFSTNNTERFRVTPGGKFSINTTDTLRNFTVGGSVRITNLFPANPTRIVGANVSGDLTYMGLGAGLSIDTTSEPVLQLSLTGSNFPTQVANTVFAGPVSGGNATPTFRSLVAADIPNLATSKITSGTFSVERGGTGVSTITGVVIGNGNNPFVGVSSSTGNQLFRRNSANNGYEFFSPAYVDSTRSISTSGSLTGGGTLGANRTLSLVNDNATPGNSKYYGTNSSGTKGFYDLPSGGGSDGNGIYSGSGTIPGSTTSKVSLNSTYAILFNNDIEALRISDGEGLTWLQSKNTVHSIQMKNSGLKLYGNSLSIFDTTTLDSVVLKVANDLTESYTISIPAGKPYAGQALVALDSIGGYDWVNVTEVVRDTVLKTTTHTALKLEIALIDCSGGTRTVNPPSAPVLGDWFVVSDATANSNTNNITVDFVTASQNLYGSSQNYIINANGGYVKFIYAGSVTGWIATKG